MQRLVALAKSSPYIKYLLNHRFIIFFIIFFLSLLFILSKNINIGKNNENQLSVTALIPAITSNVSNEQKWKIIKFKNGNAQTIFVFSSAGINEIVRWNDYLLYGSIEDKRDIKLYLYNIKTGETKIMFNQHSENLELGGFALINNTFFFTTSGYLQKGASYWIDFIDLSIHKLAYEGKMERIKNRYFLIKEEGDSCWDKIDFYLIDIKTKAVTPAANTYSGCPSGDEYLGINNNDSMLLSYHISDGKMRWPPGYIYTNLIARPLTNPAQRSYLLAGSAMPPAINLVKYSMDEDRVLLLGNSIYAYSFNPNKLEEIASFPEEWIQQEDSPIIIGWKRNIVCVEKSDERNSHVQKIFIDLERKIVSKDTISCPHEFNDMSHSQYVEKSKQEVFKDLHLPPEYKLIYQ